MLMPAATHCSPWSALPGSLDAPDLIVDPSPLREAADPSFGGQNGPKKPNRSIHKPRQPQPVLAVAPSATLRDELIAEIHALKGDDGLALWRRTR